MTGTPCVGCLGDGKCWVCLGYGLIEYARGKHRPCHRCVGSGRCWLCQALTIRDLGRPPELTP